MWIHCDESREQRVRIVSGNALFCQEWMSPGHAQQTQNICITFVQRRDNVFDVDPSLYKYYTNALRLLGHSLYSVHDIQVFLYMSIIPTISSPNWQGVATHLSWRSADDLDPRNVLNWPLSRGTPLAHFVSNPAQGQKDRQTNRQTTK